MKRFCLNIVAFSFIGLVIGEIIVRSFDLTIDVPEMYVDKNQLIRYYPNQTGNYLGGKHKWVINKYGFYGYEPKRLDSLVIVLGDSFISNELNPPACHQCQYLSELIPRFNFFPVSRDGASFLELMEFSARVDTLQPMYQLLYVHDNDFIQSIVELGRENIMSQVRLSDGHFFSAELSYSPIKRAFFQFKFLYFLYKITKTSFMGRQPDHPPIADYCFIEKFIEYVSKHYSARNKILIFRPDSSPRIVELAIKYGFQVFVLRGTEASWEMDHDRHWSCYGHQQAAIQVSRMLGSLPERE